MEVKNPVAAVSAAACEKCGTKCDPHELILEEMDGALLKLCPICYGGLF